MKNNLNQKMERNNTKFKIFTQKWLGKSLFVMFSYYKGSKKTGQV